MMKIEMIIIFSPLPSNAALVEWNWRGKPVPVPLCPPQIPHGLTRDRTRASAVEGRRLAAWATVPLLYSQGTSSVIDWARGRVGHGAGLEVREKRVIPYLCPESNDDSLVAKPAQPDTSCAHVNSIMVTDFWNTRRWTSEFNTRWEFLNRRSSRNQPRICHHKEMGTSGLWVR
jgi:hypothetical protein